MGGKESERPWKRKGNEHDRGDAVGKRRGNGEEEMYGEEGIGKRGNREEDWEWGRGDHME